MRGGASRVIRIHTWLRVLTTLPRHRLRLGVLRPCLDDHSMTQPNVILPVCWQPQRMVYKQGLAGLSSLKAFHETATTRISSFTSPSRITTSIIMSNWQNQNTRTERVPGQWENDSTQNQFNRPTGDPTDTSNSGQDSNYAGAQADRYAGSDAGQRADYSASQGAGRDFSRSDLEGGAYGQGNAPYEPSSRDGQDFERKRDWDQGDRQEADQGEWSAGRDEPQRSPEGKPGIGSRVLGGVEQVAGKTTRNPNLVERGAERKSRY